MREPVFTETLQVAIVVRDFEAAMPTYVDDYGIGPWDIYEFNPGNMKDLREYGQPVERSCRLAVARRFLGTSTSLGRLTREVGYADQAHLTRESVQLAGPPPARLLRGWHRDCQVHLAATHSQFRLPIERISPP